MNNTDGPRACQVSEFAEVVGLINHIFREGADQDIQTDYPFVFNETALDYMRILKVGGKVVANVPVTRHEFVANDDTFAIGIIGATGTHPDNRKKGYATVCLQDCVRIMEEQNWPLSVLWTMEATFPFYQNSGWEAVTSQSQVYKLQPEDRELFDAGPFDIIRYDKGANEYLEAIMEIRDTEPCRIKRSRKVYETLLTLPKINTYLAVSAQDVGGYLVFGEGTNKPGIIEAGGSLQGLEALVGYVLAKHSKQEIKVVLPIMPTKLGELLEIKKPMSGQRDGDDFQMIRINSLEKLLRGIEGHLRRKSTGIVGEVRLVCKESGRGLTMKFRDGDVSFSNESVLDEIVLTRRELVQLIFGGHQSAKVIECKGNAGKILQKIFPCYCPVWVLDRS